MGGLAIEMSTSVHSVALNSKASAASCISLCIYCVGHVDKKVPRFM
jgi:hypothetical protein